MIMNTYFPDWMNGVEYAVAIFTPGHIAKQIRQTQIVYRNAIQTPYRYENASTSAKGNENKENTDKMRELQKRIKTMEQLERINESKSKDMEHDLGMMKQKNRELNRRCIQMENRSMEITREMSRLTESRGNFENVNEEFANSNLARTLESLYSNKWVFLAKWMSKTFPNIEELERISLLTRIMKVGYEECKSAADGQICTMLLVDRMEDIPPNEDLSEVLTLRRKFALRDSSRNKMKQEVSKHLFLTEDVNVLCTGEKRSIAKQKLQAFLNEYLDCCWLLSVSNPPVILQFDVVGKPYTECKDRFTKYSTKQPVEDMDKFEGTVYEVVWPCMQLQDDYVIYVKGDVVVVKKGKIKSSIQAAES